jgi:alanyl-tRNA synthetase
MGVRRDDAWSDRTQERSRIAADWPRCGQNRRDGWRRFTFVVRGTSALAQLRNKEKPMNAMPSEKIETTVEDPNLAAVSEVEAGIRDFVRNDVAYLRRSPSMLATEPALDASAEATVNNVNSLIQRVAGTSLTEIENLVSELESLRDLLHSEGQRVQREISGYAQLSQAAMKSTRMIADNVAQWKRAADGLRNG